MEDILFLMPGYMSGENTNHIVETIKIVKPKKYVVYFDPWEAFCGKFTEYFRQNYNIYPEHCESIKDFENVLVDNNLTFYLILSGFKTNSDIKNHITNPIQNFVVLNWPTSYLHHCYYPIIHAYGLNPSMDKSRVDKIYTNYNHQPRTHRSLMMDLLSKYNLIDDGINTWHYGADENYYYPYKYWDPINMYFDDFDRNALTKVYTQKALKTYTLFNLVSESQIDEGQVFYTEKTCRQLILGEPFLILGCKNQNKKLEDLGFNRFYEIFDYRFDELNDIELRALGIIDNIITNKHKDLRESHESIKQHLTHNQNRALQIVNQDPYFPKELMDLFYEYGQEFLDLFKPFDEGYRDNYNLPSDFSFIRKVFGLDKDLI